MNWLLCLFVVASCQLCHSLTVDAPTPGLIDVLSSLELTSFLEGLKLCKIDKTINHEGHFTIFAPNNDAFAKEKWYPGENDYCSKMSFHIAKGYFKAEDLQDEQVVKSLLSKRTIRINIYPFKNNVTTANGRTIVDTNHLARNGVVHVISEVMSSVYRRAGSVVSELDECCPEHSDLLEILKLSGYYEKLNSEGPFTLLAPNNGAFAKLHPDFIIHLRKNKTAMYNLVSGHVIPLTYYSAGLPDTLDVKTLLGNTVTATNTNGKVMFGRATVTLSDVTAGNGVVHAIDEILFVNPPSIEIDMKMPRVRLGSTFSSTAPKKNLVELCKELGFTSFAAAMKLTGLDKVVKHEGLFTIFAPSNEAFNNPDTYPGTFNLADRVRFHVGRGLVKPSTIKDEDQIMTLLNKRKIKFNVYEGVDVNGDVQKVITANGREVSFTNYEAHNGMIHELVSSGMDYIYQVNGTLEHEIGLYPQFSTFITLVKTHLGDVLNHNTGFVLTVLVPTNSVLDKALEVNPPEDVAEYLLLNHFIPKSWYTIGLELTGKVKTLGGKQIEFGASSSGYTINTLPLEKVDFTASNGVFHQINGLL